MASCYGLVKNYMVILPLAFNIRFYVLIQQRQVVTVILILMYKYSSKWQRLKLRMIRLLICLDQKIPQRFASLYLPRSRCVKISMYSMRTPRNTFKNTPALKHIAPLKLHSLLFSALAPKTAHSF